MMKKIAAPLFETVHLAAASLLLTMSAWVATIPAPVRAWKGSGLAKGMRAETVAGELEQFLLERGPWIGLVGLIGVSVASTLRGDVKKLLPAARILASGVAALFALWASMDLKEHRLPQAWNCLFVSIAADVALTAWMVGGGKGGSSKAAAKPEK